MNININKLLELLKIFKTNTKNNNILLSTNYNSLHLTMFDEPNIVVTYKLDREYNHNTSDSYFLSLRELVIKLTQLKNSGIINCELYYNTNANAGEESMCLNGMCLNTDVRNELTVSLYNHFNKPIPTKKQPIDTALIESFTKLKPCISDDETRYYLNGIHYNPTDHRLEATNGHILTTVKYIFNDSIPEHIISKHIVKFLIKNKKLITSQSYYQVHNDSIYITINDELSIFYKTIDGVYPDTNKLIGNDVDLKYHVTFKKEDLQQILKSIKEFLPKHFGDRGVIFNTTHKNIEIYPYVTPDIKYNIPCESNMNYKLGFNYNYLITVLKILEKEEYITLKYKYEDYNPFNIITKTINIALMPMRI